MKESRRAKYAIMELSKIRQDNQGVTNVPLGNSPIHQDLYASTVIKVHIQTRAMKNVVIAMKVVSKVRQGNLNVKSVNLGHILTHRV